MRNALPWVAAIIGTAALAADPVGPGMSPIVTWDPDRGMISRPPTRRPLAAAEAKVERTRGEAIWEAFKRTRAFSQPGEYSTHLDVWPVISQRGLVEGSLIAKWTRPFDTRRHKDGAWYSVMGAAGSSLYMRTNFDLSAGHVTGPDARGDYSRTAPDGTAYFAQPRTFGQIGGGTIYTNAIVFTRDGRHVLEAAPLGALLDIEAARLKKWIAEADRHAGSGLQQLEQSMTAEAIAERRARRERIWARETRDPAALARRLDAAHRTDESDYQRQKERLSPGSGPRDARSAYWAPRMALERVESQQAALADRSAAACGRIDTTFGSQSSFNVSYEAAGAPDCVPMVQLRKDLLDATLPPGEVQLFIVDFVDRGCGLYWGSTPQRAGGGGCEQFVPTLRELDWGAIRRALGWPEQAS